MQRQDPDGILRAQISLDEDKDLRTLILTTEGPARFEISVRPPHLLGNSDLIVFGYHGSSPNREQDPDMSVFLISDWMEGILDIVD